MLVKDVDITKVYELLNSVPDYMEIESIDLTNGYHLKLIAGTDELRKIEYDTSLDELNNILKGYGRKMISKK